MLESCFLVRTKNIYCSFKEYYPRTFHEKNAILTIVFFIFSQSAFSNNIDHMDLEGLLGVDVFDVASNVNQDISRQPVSISVIYGHQLQLSGARTLNEALKLFVPGFYLVHDHDDDIAAFRGFAPDNNSKFYYWLMDTILIPNGFGVPAMDFNGMNFDYIDRVEVIRGPGSVTLELVPFLVSLIS